MVLTLSATACEQTVYARLNCDATVDLRNRRLLVRIQWGVLDLRRFEVLLSEKLSENRGVRIMRTASFRQNGARSEPFGRLWLLPHTTGGFAPCHIFPSRSSRRAAASGTSKSTVKQVSLGPDRDEAFRRYYQLVERSRGRRRSPRSIVLQVIDAFARVVLEVPVRRYLSLAPRPAAGIRENHRRGADRQPAAAVSCAAVD